MQSRKNIGVVVYIRHAQFNKTSTCLLRHTKNKTTVRGPGGPVECSDTNEHFWDWRPFLLQGNMFPSYYINLMAQQLDQKINGVPDFGMIGRNWGAKSNDYQGGAKGPCLQGWNLISEESNFLKKLCPARP